MQYKIIAGIAKTHLLSRFKQTVIAGLGVTFGIGTFITLISFMTGLNGLLDGLILNRTPHIHIFNEIRPSLVQPIDLLKNNQESFNVIHSIQPKKNQLRIRNSLPILKDLAKNSNVKGVIPQVTAQIFYLAGSIKLNGVINGIDALEEDRLFSLSDYVVEGSVESLANTSKGILLGAGLAKKMAVGLNDNIQVTTVNGNLFSLKIVGIYQSGLAEIDDIQSYTNLKMAQRIMGKADNYITDINVKLYAMELAETMSKEINKKFNLTAIDINTANAQFETGTAIRNIITYAVSITLLIVAGFGIYNILNMFIYEKMNDIAILKATGFSGKDVQYIFISQAMIIGIVGGIVGLVIGYCFSVLINHTPFETEALPTIKTFPVNFNPAYYVIGIVFAIVSTFLAGFLPAQKARRIDPVEIIRGQ
jgi:lipoprotein-releasing system permease protein